MLMADTALSHVDITNKFDAADLDEVDIEIEGHDEPAGEDTSPDCNEAHSDEAVSPDLPVDEEIVEPVDHADARCIEAKQHVTNCGCTGSCRGPF